MDVLGNIKPALLCGAIRRVSALGIVAELLRNPVDHLLAGWSGMDVKSSRVMVRGGDCDDLARGLVEYGV